MTTTLSATYSPEDNKLRLYASTRLARSTYERVRAAGFIWAPKQELFVAPMWTPEREDLLLELCGEIGDEDTSLVERAEERADRFGDYSDARRQDAEQARRAVSAIADNIPLGQPILVGHHSERHARKDAQRIENGMRRTIQMWDTAQYWQRRAAGAVRAAKYKERPDVRARRIKTLEAGQRKQERYVTAREQIIRAYTDAKLVEAALPDGRGVVESLLRSYDGGLSFEQMSQCMRGELQVADALPIALENLRRFCEHARRWMQHFSNRIAYERAMLEAAGGTVADKTGPEVGGACKCWASPRGGWSYIKKVNKVSVTVLDNWGNGGRDFARTIPFDKLSQIMTKAQVQEKRDAGMLVHIDARGFHLRDAPLDPKIVPVHGEGRSVFHVVDAAAPEADQPAVLASASTRAQADATIEQMRATVAAGAQAIAVPQLFPTPPDIARRMVALAQIEPGMRVLEPSAGTGNLLRALPGDCEVCAVEINRSLCDKLLGGLPPGIKIHCGDFLAVRDPEAIFGPFDVVIMNPPFENGADIKHIEHALTMLKPGGTLVAICAAGPRQEALRDHARTWAMLPDGSFAGTGVRAQLIVIDKPKRPAESERTLFDL